MSSERNNNSVKFKDKNIDKLSSERCKDLPSIKKWTFYIPAVAAILCYVNGLHGDFVHDDVFAIKNNPDVFGNTRISSLFMNDYWGKPMSHPRSHKSYRPLTVLSFRLNYILTGKDPFYFHLVNSILHLTVTCLFLYTCRHVFRFKEKCSVLCATLFAVHPIHTEAVTGIVGRADLLAAVFFLLSFITYTRSLSSPKHGPMAVSGRFQFMVSIFLAAVAMLCKENGVTVLGVSALYDAGVICKKEISRVCYMRRVSADCIPLLRRTCIITISIILMLTFRWWIMNGELPPFIVQDNPASFQKSPVTRWMTFTYIWSYNVWLLMAPVSLSYDWQSGSIPLVESVFDPRNQATVMFTVVLTVFVCVSLLNIKDNTRSGKNNIAYLFLVFTVVPFIPASNIFFRVGFVIAERILYIPSLGFCICVASGFERLSSHWGRYEKPLLAVFFTLLLMFAAKTWCRNKVWESRETIFRSGVQTLPHNAKTHYNYANYLKDAGQSSEAIEHYRETLRLDDNYAQAHNNLGTLLEGSSEAENHFRKTIQLVPKHQGAHVNLGNLYFKRGDHEEGFSYLRVALSFDDENPDALTSLATCYIETGNFTGAEALLKAVLDKNPDYLEARVSYGGLFSKLGKHAEAAKHYQMAYQIDMSRGTALVNAASEYKKLGNIKQAETLLKQAITARNDPLAFEQLAILYYHSGRTDESVGLFDEMSRTFPNSTETMLRHAKVLANTNSFQRAESILLTILSSEPNNIDARWTLAHVFSKQEKHLQAIEHLNKTIKLAEEHRRLDLFQLYADRGDNYKDIQKYDLAFNDYKRALEHNANDGMVHGNIGAIYHLYRKFDEAEYHYREALKLDPSNKLVLGNMEKLGRMRIQAQMDKG